MTALATPSLGSPSARGLLARIVVAGFAGGAVDFVYASAVGLLDGRSVPSVWRGVASGWLGRSALEGGLASSALGVATHFSIATVMASAYVLLARRIPLVRRRPLLTAPVYGLVLYGVMYGVVLPLRWPQAFPRWDGAQSALDILTHMGVALAIAWVAARPANAPSAAVPARSSIGD